MIKAGLHIVLLFACCAVVKAQTQSDTTWYQLRFQQTVVTQYHPGFSAAYSGANSLQQHEEAQTSLTTTFYTGAKIFRNTFIYFNPEIAGGAGLRRATGVAGFPNGETFRVGNPKPQIYVARLFIEKYIPLGMEKSYRGEEYNAVAAYIPEKYIRLIGGRFAISDFFDNNSFSHDPRTQFLNWSLMGNGAFDYAANTRGYTWGAVAELKLNKVSLRYAASMVPRTANASNMDPDLKNALAQQAEADYRWGTKRKGVIRFLAFMNRADMGVYKNAVALASQNSDTPDVILTRQKGNRKYGFGVNVEKEISDYAGVFARASYNDGRTETWMFTKLITAFQPG
ncbi:MAG: carbohydrate porin [Bacteroidota bacterium]